MTDFDYDLETRAAHDRQASSRSTATTPQASRSHRLWATAPDGTRVPISLVHRRGLPRRRHGAAAALRLRLLRGLDRPDVLDDPRAASSTAASSSRSRTSAAAASWVGSWYEDGKLDRKRNTFTDFIACAEHLVAEGYTSPDRLVARGGSAGGLLMGAVANLRPDLFDAIVAEVPFVDCLTTMLDETLPLTITEWEEWGDPLHDPAMYDYIKGYSPYDNVRDRALPRDARDGGAQRPTRAVLGARQVGGAAARDGVGTDEAAVPEDRARRGSPRAVRPLRGVGGGSARARVRADSASASRHDPHGVHGAHLHRGTASL